MDGLPGTGHHRIGYGIEQIHGAKQKRFAAFVPESHAGAVEPVNDMVAHPVVIVAVASQGRILLRGDIHPGKAYLQQLRHENFLL